MIQTHLDSPQSWRSIAIALAEMFVIFHITGLVDDPVMMRSSSLSMLSSCGMILNRLHQVRLPVRYFNGQQ